MVHFCAGDYDLEGRGLLVLVKIIRRSVGIVLPGEKKMKWARYFEV